MKNNMFQLAVFAVCLIYIHSVQADNMYREAWYLIPGASILWTDSNLEAKDHGSGLFLKLGRELTPHWDIQGGVSYNRVHEDTGMSGVGGHYKQMSVDADFLYLFNRQQIRPFLLIGAGVARNKLDYNNLPGLHDEMRTSLMGNVGLGAQLFLNDQFGLQVDVRRQWSRFDAKAPISHLDASGTISNTLLNIGGIFRFGAPSQPLKAYNTMVVPDFVPLQKHVEIPSTPLPDATIANCNPRFETITLSVEELFAFNKYEIHSDMITLLDEVATKLKAYPDFKLVIITGHADRIGSARYNQQLSERRANHVRDYLISAGIAANRLKSIGKGESEPKVTCSDMRRDLLIQCLQPNRRVVIQDEGQHLMASPPECP